MTAHNDPNGQPHEHGDFDPQATGINSRGIPSPICPNCGSDWLLVPVTFTHDDYEIAAWGMDAYCYCCKSPVTAPCPADLTANAD